MDEQNAELAGDAPRSTKCHSEDLPFLKEDNSEECHKEIFCTTVRSSQRTHTAPLLNASLELQAKLQTHW